MFHKPHPLTKEELTKLYVEEGKATLQVAKELGTSQVTVCKYLKIHGIKARPFSTKGLKTRLGAVLSQETKEKIRQKAIGRKIPLEVRKRMGSPGSKNSGWIDGRTPENKRQRRTVEYKLWRKAVYERDNYTCQECGKRGGETHADHIKPFALFPELRTSIANGRTLCVPCHRKTSTYGGRARKKKSV